MTKIQTLPLENLKSLLASDLGELYQRDGMWIALPSEPLRSEKPNACSIASSPELALHGLYHVVHGTYPDG